MDKPTQTEMDFSGTKAVALDEPTALTVVRGMEIRFTLEADAYGANVYIETTGILPQGATKYHVIGATWNDIATAIQALLTTQAAATGSTPK